MASPENMPMKGEIVRKRKVADGYVLTIKGPRGKEYEKLVAPKSQLVKPIPGWDNSVAFNLKPDGTVWNVRRQMPMGKGYTS
ncbi:hypothetical protein KY325_02375 [Candidatus Woesearchaeota archaeon]|nr:hypothetical protein [Candidatus Woesearchaeota archaeon]MBW3017980.1 hypothetical protein [Candidatus Woesearchaeota archaeon]